MADQEKEKSQELGLIDITEILSDYLRIFRRMWAWVLIFTILGAGLSYVRARLQGTAFQIILYSQMDSGAVQMA